MIQYERLYRIRHVDGLRVRRLMVVSAPTRKAAQDFVEDRYGAGWFFSAVRLVA